VCKSFKPTNPEHANMYNFVVYAEKKCMLCVLKMYQDCTHWFSSVKINLMTHSS
jgi:hypothetical protein